MIPAIGIGPLGVSEWRVGGLGTTVPSVGGRGANGTGQSFGEVLTGAISSLTKSQASAGQAATALAAGQLSNPTQAVVAVENASLAMDFASQLRNQIDTAATTLFQTQL